MPFNSSMRCMQSSPMSTPNKIGFVVFRVWSACRPYTYHLRILDSIRNNRNPCVPEPLRLQLTVKYFGNYKRNDWANARQMHDNPVPLFEFFVIVIFIVFASKIDFAGRIRFAFYASARRFNDRKIIRLNFRHGLCCLQLTDPLIIARCRYNCIAIMIFRFHFPNI